MITTLWCYPQEAGISLNYTDTELISIFERIEKETGYFFLFNEKLINTAQKVTINAKDKIISNLLDELFKNTNIKYSIINNKIILSPDYLEFNKVVTVSGI
ncbi:MAG TPA: STN domain-containing protein, partial [Candidatus Cloacimonadota bacterium]|nr:STN domain-containing protein [Candidatus Cloacimonadota bacterium]